MGRMFSKIVLLLLIAYMTFGVGSADAILWCVEQGGLNHVEYNSAGKCQVSCDSVPNIKRDNSATSFYVGIDGKAPCQDYSITPPITPKSNDSLHGDILSVDGKTLSSTVPFAPMSTNVRIGLAPKPPPPTLTLTVLRTVVLLI